jgi:hypothetical protein
MPGMAHNHSAMHRPTVEGISLAVLSQACATNCVNAELLNNSRKVIPQVTVVQRGVVVLGATSFPAPHLVAAWSLDSGPPSLPSESVASYSILRI